MKIETKELDHGQLIMNTAHAELLRQNGLVTARKLWGMQSDPVKNVLEERGTGRFFLEPVQGTQYVEAYIKRYTPVPLKEKIKCFLSLKFGTFDAFHEWEAIKTFHMKGLATVEPLAAARFGKNTCNLTQGITDYKRASELFASFGPKDRDAKLKLIANIGTYAGRMHVSGLAHQDFYLVHMFVKPQEDFKVYLIDLQRVIIGREISFRYRVKDLGQLLFSASKFITRTDILRFWKAYTAEAGTGLYHDKGLIRAVFRKSAKISGHDENRKRKKQQRGGRETCSNRW